MADRAKVEQSVFDYLKPRLKQYETEHGVVFASQN